jgi:predicted kinase
MQPLGGRPRTERALYECHQEESMSSGSGRLLFLCGRMAAGKSTLARQLASDARAALLVEDDFLARLFPDQVVDLAAYVMYSGRIREVLAPHICSLLSLGLSVVLDFPANSRRQRAWFRRLIDDSGAEHELHFVDVPDEVCLRQLKLRSAGIAEERWTSEAEFHLVNAYFEPPTADEGFHIVRHGN